MKVCGLDELDAFTKELIQEMGSIKIVLLQGNLASGKTTFVQSFASSLGLSTKVSSPTFSIMNEYEDKIRHYDIYQKGLSKFMENGLLETLMDEDKYYLIEWADSEFEKMLKNIGFEFIKVQIEAKKTKRLYKVSKCTL